MGLQSGSRGSRRSLQIRHGEGQGTVWEKDARMEKEDTRDIGEVDPRPSPGSRAGISCVVRTGWVRGELPLGSTKTGQRGLGGRSAGAEYQQKKEEMERRKEGREEER